MKLFKNLFIKPKIECPRCLGKGKVNWEDISRLNKELKWIPGTCAYCNGDKKVHYDQESKIAVDSGYLTTDLSLEERKRLIANDMGAIQRGINRETQTDNFIAEVEFLHFEGEFGIDKIFDFYTLPQKEIDIHERNELLGYITRIIDFKKGEGG